MVHPVILGKMTLYMVLYQNFIPEMKHIMQEEKGDPTCRGSLSPHKLYAPARRE